MCSVHRNLLIVVLFYFLMIAQLLNGLRDSELDPCLKTLRTPDSEGRLGKFGSWEMP